MQAYWLRRTGHNRRLAVFVLGWAADWRVAADAVAALPADVDALAIYDYRECGVDDAACDAARSTLAAYSHTFLFAWSFGVMMAERIFFNHRFTRAVAINGTQQPVDEHFGIEPRRMTATLRGLARGGMEAFERKTYAEHYDRFRELVAGGTASGATQPAGGTISPRPLDDNIHELNVLCELAAREHGGAIEWDEAIVGTRDEIFMPQNQLAAWASRAKELPLPHYPFADMHLWAAHIF